MTGSPRPEGTMIFWECLGCHMRIVTDNRSGEIESYPQTYMTGMPATCPRCQDERTYVEQARIVLVKVQYSFGHLQWVPGSWSMVIEVDK